jgi:PAS domain S-box-containing protein
MADLPGISEERQLALLVSSAAEYAIFMLDPEGRILTWNAGAQRLKGYDRDEIVGQHFSVFYTDEDRAREHPAHELRLALRDGSYEEEGWRVRKDGSRFWANVVITAVYDPTGAHIGFGKVSRDLTARRMAEEQSRERTADLEVANEELSEFRRLVSSVRDYAIFMLDPAGHIRSWNAGARRLKGYEPEEVIGSHFSIFYSADDKARDHPAHELRLAIRDGRYEEEGWRLRKDGSTFWAGVTITAIRDEDGRLTGFAKVTRDLTERKRADDALRDALEELRRANQELDRFASVAAHDMTDPLRTISGFAELIVSGHRSAEENHQYAEHIYASSLRLSDMLQGLLSYARAGHVTVPGEPVALGPAVADVLSDLTGLIADSGATVNVGVDSRASVWATPGDVRTVLQNLISNAVKFGDPQAPVVDIAAEPADDGTLYVTVKDNGAGVAEGDRERIFGAFERATPGAGQTGYGLGLAICQRLVARHGGQIGIDSGPRGSCVWFRIPVPPGVGVPAAGREA